MDNELNDDTHVKAMDKSTLEKLTPMEKVYAVMRVNGYNRNESYKLAGGKGGKDSTRPYSLEKSIRTKSVVSPKMVKLAHSAIKETLEMKPVTVIETVNTPEGSKTVEKNVYPSHTNRLDAAKLILNRSEPEVQKHMNLNVDVKAGKDLIDLSGYMDNSEDEISAVEVTELTQNKDVPLDVKSDPKGV